MPGKPGEWVPLILCGPILLVPAFRCDEFLGDACRRAERLRRWHNAGIIRLQRRDPGTGKWLEVAAHEWRAVNFTRGLLIDRDNVGFGPIEACLAKFPPRSGGERRTALLREAWLGAGRPAVWSARNPQGWTAARASAEVLLRYSEIIWIDGKPKRIPDKVVERLFDITERQLRREFRLAWSDIKPL